MAFFYFFLYLRDPVTDLPHDVNAPISALISVIYFLNCICEMLQDYPNDTMH